MPLEEEEFGGKGADKAGKGNQQPTKETIKNESGDKPIEKEDIPDFLKGSDAPLEEETISLKASDFKQMQEQIAGLVKKVNEQPLANPKAVSDSGVTALAELLKQMNYNSSKSTDKNFDENNQFIFSMNEYDSVDEEDMLKKEEYVTFVSYSFFDVIVGDVKGGKPVKAPFKPITFEILSSRREKNGREEEIVHMSAYTCRSRKELQFLRNHSMFGVSFFDNPSFDKKKAGVHSRWAQKMASLKGNGQLDLRQLCNQYGVEFTSELENVRGEIALKMIEKEDLDAAAVTQNALNENHLEMLKNQK